ncbi:FecR family protein [Thauera linaloolentis]|uniref:Fe2+-dicitrate sensor, membrane protein n=1 Tax=Thauera linaloolentis (strain DSM 12138 / JCM 21573 / CCUG 41526 / CIP 105981 / IAM 15112 / NBRC 102519 / 47Lol) TaxID=1123367 RepID=N6YVJ0_THAL4|nr:FecR family protein [Thauera linaloolentis]ENO83964.1 Fe2+-dicitrate sensor, membrane protein [Thauera linaloolentis 47Lol = DSM 12138]MCM8567544.1 FecR family protein [Thauera linaloolentis]
MTTTANPPASDPIAGEAIAWMVRLGAGDASAAERAAYAAWRQADPRHEAAAVRLEQAIGAFARLPDSGAARAGARRALLAPPNRRKTLGKILGIGFLLGGSGYLLHRHQPLPELLADAATGTGERRQLVLPDGSSLWLNARSAADFDFGPALRQVRLQCGELIVEVARDSARPFVVHTAEGSIRALGTRFLVRQDAGNTLVAVLHSSVRIDTGLGASITLAVGRSARFDLAGVRPDATPPASASAWEDGFIEVHDRPLAEIVAALRPYRPGLLRVSPAAGQLRVTGSFPLDDSERTLAALSEALPIRIDRHTDYWVSIDLR